MIKGYWYRGEGGLNLGDALNPLLFRRLLGVTLEWAPPKEAEVFGIGSNIEMIPGGFTGVILGTGIASPHTRRNLSRAHVLAVRGNLTAAVCGLGRPLLADLGLLAADLLEDWPAQDIPHGYIRHFADHRPTRGFAIDVIAGPEYVIRQAARCERITSSSLHGLILADSIGIPSRWAPHHSTRMVKFEDYASSFREILHPYVWRRAHPPIVTEKQEALREALRSLP